MSAIFFMAKISKLKVKKKQQNRGDRYEVVGQLFFASVEGFVDSFNFNVSDSRIVIDFSTTFIQKPKQRPL
ncbi:hypothetical protein GCM10008968_02250 [Bacillus horti]